MANKAHEAVATHSIHKHMQMNRPSLRTCDWTQNLKPLPTTPTRHLGQRVTQSRPQSSAPQNPQNIACDADIRRRKHAPCIIEAATIASLTAHGVSLIVALKLMPWNYFIHETCCRHTSGLVRRRKPKTACDFIRLPTKPHVRHA